MIQQQFCNSGIMLTHQNHLFCDHWKLLLYMLSNNPGLTATCLHNIIVSPMSTFSLHRWLFVSLAEVDFEVNVNQTALYSELEHGLTVHNQFTGLLSESIRIYHESTQTGTKRIFQAGIAL